MLCGHYEEAARHLSAASELAEQVLAKGQIESKLGELAFKQGDMERAIQCLERALGLLSHKIPRNALALYPRLAWEAVVQLLHSLLPRVFVGRKQSGNAETTLLACRIYNRLAYAYWFKRGQYLCLWAHLRGMNLGETFPPSAALAHAYSLHAPVMSLVALFDRGIAYARKSHAIRKSLGDLWGQGQALSFQGIALYAASRFEECIDQCHEAYRLLDRTGDRWEVNVARVHTAFSLFRLGQLSACAELSFRIHEAGVELGDAQASGYSLDVWAQSLGPRASAEILQTELDRPREDTQVTCQVLMAEGVRLFWLDRIDEAGELFERSHQLAERAGVRNAYTLPLRSWLASSLRRQAEATSCWEPERRRQLLKRADGIARKAVRVARSHQNDLPHALREAGLVRLMQGSVRQARNYLDESLDVAQRQGAKFEHAQTLLARGRAGAALGWPRASEEEAEARRALIELGADFALDEPVNGHESPETDTLSLADRFDTVLESGRTITTALNQETVFTAVRETALRLLRSEQCTVRRIDPGGDDTSLPMAEKTSGDVCPVMLRRALTDARAVVYAEGAGEPDAVSEGLLLSGVRSALCAPILVRGRAEACFYVTHRGVSGLFGEDEQHLADFIATIAGAALENAEGFAQLQQLTATLEERVQERTAALEQSNLELKQFAYIASHDLQSPLRAVAGFAQFLQQDYRGKLDEKADERIDRIVEGAKRMQTMINDLLTYSRVESRSRQFEQVELNEVFDDAVTLLRAEIEDGGEVTRGELPSVMGDRSQLSQLLQNLIGNGLKYHGDQPPRVEVSAEQNGREYTVAVRDNGIGIDARHHERIFEIFRRLHTQDKYPGTGIGLAVCRRIVHRHGGRIWLESAEGQGTTFYFTIPERGREE